MVDQLTVPPIRALTVDLDDTLWAAKPLLIEAERRAFDYLQTNVPQWSTHHDRDSLAELRRSLLAANPERTHDLRWLRRTVYERAIERCGGELQHASLAFNVFDEARQQVILFEGVEDALARLARCFPLVALTNGFADLQRIGLGHHFKASVSGVDFGRAKPDPSIFRHAAALTGVAAEAVLHVGDDWTVDVEGAIAAGLQAAWVSSGAPTKRPQGLRYVVRTVAELADRLLLEGSNLP